MNDQSTSNNDLPPPLQIIWGIIQLCCGLVLSCVGAICSVFQMTSPLGRPLTKGGNAMAYYGGHNIGAGFAGSFRMLGNIGKSKPAPTVEQSYKDQ